MPGVSSPLLAGTPAPLGASWWPVTSDVHASAGVNFAVHAPAAAALWLALHDADGVVVARWPFPGRDGDVFHAFLPAPLGTPGLDYTVSTTVDGPSLIEPYALRVVDADGAPRARVVDTAPLRLKERRPAVPWSETVIHEIHVKGYTQLHPAVPAAWRGKYLGLTVPAVLEHLKGSGATAIELLPVQCFRTEDFLRAKGLPNYWGYNPLAWFAPAAQYAVEDPVAEFREMVRAVHAAGLEVILDVVFNHTCEGGQDGPVLSWRGLDDVGTYHRLPNDASRYDNLTGCGNAVNLSTPAVRNMVVDCLRWWVEGMGVDGFRFDLASTLGRGAHGFDAEHPFFVALKSDPTFAFVKWVAEPWDIGPGGYQFGAFPEGWAEWNDRYRDTVRSFWRGDGQRDAALLGQFAERVAGSADVFRRRARRPWASVNFITAHDGYTLRDLVSYEQRHNEANREDNRDGHGHNLSWNCGAEGPSAEPQVAQRRARQQRNFLMSLFLSLGTPMLQGGDELGRTSLGNNNAYCQDNELSWVDWAAADTALAAFAAALAKLRRERPELRSDRYLKGARRAGRDCDIAWLHPAGHEMNASDWHAGSTVLGVVRAAPMDGRDLLWLLNPTASEIEFRLPRRWREVLWRLLFDSAQSLPGPGPNDLPGPQEVFRLLPHQSLLFERMVFP
jgi:isoamylase